ncbi:MAG: beta-galactosidase [Vulcanimicrobiaceae bacterium]
MPVVKPWTVVALAVLCVCAGSPYAAEFAAPPSRPALASVGGYQGSRYRPLRDGAVVEYSEDIALSFAAPIVPAFSYSIRPATASRVRIAGSRAIFTIRKVPGVRYTIAVGSAARFHFTTRATVAMPRPAAQAAGAYRYGVLEHPFENSLAGPQADRIADLLAASGTRFVRLDFPGSDIEPTAGRYDFTRYDAMLELLARHGITALPIVLQYAAPPWSTAGAGYPAVWLQPSEFASYAAAVAAHLAGRFPNVKRIELFNEPNIRKPNWWQDGNPQYASDDGSSAAVYMRAAYAAIKAVDPKMEVVGPALASGGAHVDSRAFLTTMYANGCGTGRCWDILSVHNYDWRNPTFPVDRNVDARFDVYTDLQRIAMAHGEPKPTVMITEWGFSTDESPDGFDPRVQARYIGLGFNRYLADPSIDGVVYVNLYTPDTNFFGYTALTNKDFTPMPGFAEFRAFALRGRPRL